MLQLNVAKKHLDAWLTAELEVTSHQARRRNKLQ